MGRPRTFDADEVLELALHTFWARGYEGASVHELTAAMGISAPSLYAVFGDKRSLFQRVLERYGDQPGVQARSELAAPTARAGVERLLRSTVDRATDPATPPGCLLVQGALVAGRNNEAVRDELAALRADQLNAVRERLERAVTEGDLAPGTNTDALSRHTMVISHGLSVASLGGATIEELHATVDVAMQAWPADPGESDSRG